MPNLSEIVERVRAHISRSEVAGFTIGYSSGPPDKRVRGSDHRDHARTEEHVILAGGLTRQQALDLEAQLTAQFEHHRKYDKRGLRYTRSAGGRAASAAGRAGPLCLSRLGQRAPSHLPRRGKPRAVGSDQPLRRPGRKGLSMDR
jgi:hypothetical protein